MHKAFAKLMYPNERLELEAGPGIRRGLVMPLIKPSRFTSAAGSLSIVRLLMAEMSEGRIPF